MTFRIIELKVFVYIITTYDWYNYEFLGLKLENWIAFYRNYPFYDLKYNTLIRFLMDVSISIFQQNSLNSLKTQNANYIDVTYVIFII